MRKPFWSLLVLCGLTALAAAQQPAASKPPASPPATASVTVNGKTITIKYSAPSVRGRQIFGPGGLVSHDPTYPVWRAGANSATALHTDADLMLGNLRVPKGDYTLYALVSDPDHWQLVVNKQTGQWGLTYNAKQDLGRVSMRMSVPPAPIEVLRYELTPNQLTLEWDKHAASVPIKVQ
ncbi:MAG TPA: DUF2911 domain-containing protein [Terriglobales bacterium]|nr:DUF2911 domain-containing protein [Terriglobales bacterium]